MSDVIPCPLCNKYIDVTFSPQTCPKCEGSLVGVDREKELKEAANSLRPSPGIGNWLIVMGCVVFYLYTTGNPLRNLPFNSPSALLGNLVGKAIIWIPAVAVSYHYSKSERFGNSWGLIFLGTWFATILVFVLLI